ncbi:adenine deaminase C-terminal domain-containing protein [Barrientosiimonas marina]|uniref:adenine deaminase n=1 Tax=Lentibacillus kimchii TaxID=1542911 RepID=A0ABW2UTH4_9BACI
MIDNQYWRNRELRQHVAVIDGTAEPTIVLKNGTYLNTYTKQWLKANIWILHDRIVYVGDQLPEKSGSAEIVDCEGMYLVPGYIEPHAHPFQLYNPEELASHGAETGTTTFINDNLVWHFLLDQKKAFSIIEAFDQLPVSMYWWARFDPQTLLKQGEDFFSTNRVLRWLDHPSVIQGGELTAWPRLLDGDDRLLYWIQESNRRGKPVEGHLPGASEKTLTKLKLLGVAADHEATTGKEAIQRLQSGYQTGLRYSSIRPNLPALLEEMLAEGLAVFDHVTMTTDGSTPSFYENGIMNLCIRIAIQKGVPLADAYRMASHNAADHYGLLEDLGCIAPGRLAHINILAKKEDPTPVSVLAKGEWLVKDHQKLPEPSRIDWEHHGIQPIDFDWDLRLEDLQFSVPIGLDMVSDVIIKPYAIKADVTVDVIPETLDDAFLMLVDRKGKWRVNTAIKGFTDRLGGLASSYSTTGDLVFIGKSKQDLLLAWQRLKALGGGIVLVHDGEILFELPLALGGSMYAGNMEDLIAKEKQLKQWLQDFGYPFDDPVYAILFLSATHLPYTRVTQQGVVDVKKREALFPATMR